MTLNIILALAAFGIFHSLTAAIGIKAIFVSLMGQRAYLGLYRLFYNSVSVITLAPIFLWAVASPGETIWRMEGVLAGLFLLLQAVGMVGLVISLLQIDTLRFLGIAQAMALVEGRTLPLPAEPFVTNGVYAFVRHPLYFFSLMVLWFLPQMTDAWLGFAIGSTIYFAAGSLLEERKLLRQFGRTYFDYQQRVPWLIPFVKLPQRGTS